MRAGLCVVIVALAVPAAAAAWNHHGSRHHGHIHVQTGATGSNSVTSYSDGTLVLAASNGSSITGSVTEETHFQCVGAGWRDGGWRRGRRFGRRNGPLDVTGPSGPSGPERTQRPERPERTERTERLDRACGRRRRRFDRRQGLGWDPAGLWRRPGRPRSPRP